jgi:PIN domain
MRFGPWLFRQSRLGLGVSMVTGAMTCRSPSGVSAGWTLANRTLQLYVPERAWDETVHELRSRTDGMVGQGRLSRTTADELLAAAIALVETAVVIVPEEVYGTVRDRAVRRLPVIRRIGRPLRWQWCSMPTSGPRMPNSWGAASQPGRQTHSWPSLSYEGDVHCRRYAGFLNVRVHSNAQSVKNAPLLPKRPWTRWTDSGIGKYPPYD